MEEKIRAISKMNGLEKAYKHIYENHIPMEQVDYDSAIYHNFLSVISINTR